MRAFLASFLFLRCFAAEAFSILFRNRTGTRFDLGSINAISILCHYCGHFDILPIFIVGYRCCCVVASSSASRNFVANRTFGERQGCARAVSGRIRYSHVTCPSTCMSCGQRRQDWRVELIELVFSGRVRWSSLSRSVVQLVLEKVRGLHAGRTVAPHRKCSAH